MTRSILAVVAACCVCHPTPFAADADTTVERIEYVMGTMLEVRVTARDAALAGRAVDTAFAVVHRLDALLSDYRPDSDISRIAAGAPEAVVVSEVTFEFVARTLEFARMTGGAFDPTVGSLIELWGFKSGDHQIPDSTALQRELAAIGHADVRLDHRNRTVAVDSGVSLDPGGTGKGFALERAQARLETMELTSFYFNFGGQIFRTGADTIAIAVQHPRSDSVVISQLQFTSGSVATSGDSERFFEHDGIRYAHILDPRTGRPVPNQYAVSVFAPDPWTADALSTALFVLGPDEGEALVEQFPGVGAMYVVGNVDAWMTGADSTWQILESR